MGRVDGKLEPIAHRKLQAVNSALGEVAVPNPNSAVIWHYDKFDQDGDGDIDFEEEFHRTISSPAIKNGLLFTADFSGLAHCLDAKTGKPHWTSDLLADFWSSPLIVEDQVYVCDEDGEVAVFALSADPKLSVDASGNNEPLREVVLNTSIYGTPVVANDTLFIANKSHLFAIQDSAGD